MMLDWNAYRDQVSAAIKGRTIDVFNTKTGYKP